MINKVCKIKALKISLVTCTCPPENGLMQTTKKEYAGDNFIEMHAELEKSTILMKKASECLDLFID